MTKEQLPQIASLQCLGNTLHLGNFLLPNLGLVLPLCQGWQLPRPGWLGTIQHGMAQHGTAWHGTAQNGTPGCALALTLLAAIPGEVLLAEHHRSPSPSPQIPMASSAGFCRH